MRTAYLTCLVLLLCTAGCGSDQPSIDEIADGMIARSTADFEDVGSFTVESSNAVIYFRRTGADSLNVFDFRAVTNDSLMQPVFSPYHLPNVVQISKGIRNNASVVGTEVRDGINVIRLQATDPATFVGSSSDATDLAPSSAQLVVDAETFRVIEIALISAPLDSTFTRPITQRQVYGDYRTVDGVTIPFVASTFIEGLDVPMEQRMIEGGNLGMARQRTEQLPPGPERDAALAEIDARTEFLQTGIIEESFQVEQVRVNETAPEGLF